MAKFDGKCLGCGHHSGRAVMCKSCVRHTELRNAIRTAIADYMNSEGCSCCRNKEKHSAAQKRLAKLLSVPACKDGSGYDFYKFKSGEPKP